MDSSLAERDFRQHPEELAALFKPAVARHTKTRKQTHMPYPLQAPGPQRSCHAPEQKTLGTGTTDEALGPSDPPSRGGLVARMHHRPDRELTSASVDPPDGIGIRMNIAAFRCSESMPSMQWTTVTVRRDWFQAEQQTCIFPYLELYYIHIRSQSCLSRKLIPPPTTRSPP